MGFYSVPASQIGTGTVQAADWTVGIEYREWLLEFSGFGEIHLY